MCLRRNKGKVPLGIKLFIVDLWTGYKIVLERSGWREAVIKGTRCRIGMQHALSLRGTILVVDIILSPLPAP